MGKATGFMEFKREKPAERDPLTRINDWNEYSSPFSEEASKRQGARCMDCGTPLLSNRHGYRRLYVRMSDTQFNP